MRMDLTFLFPPLADSFGIAKIILSSMLALWYRPKRSLVALLLTERSRRFDDPAMQHHEIAADQCTAWEAISPLAGLLSP